MIIEIHTPELEDLIRQRLASGEFRDIEEVLLVAMKATARRDNADRRKKRLGQFLLESPLRGSGLIVERQQDYPRPVEL
jgi:hypothetical protein